MNQQLSNWSSRSRANNQQISNSLSGAAGSRANNQLISNSLSGAAGHVQTINKSATLYLEQQVTCKQSINQQLSTWSSRSLANNQ
jgi:hypothetical protein